MIWTPVWHATTSMCLVNPMLLTDMEWIALMLSVKVAVTATVVGAPMALGIAYFMARTEFVFKPVIDAFIHLPLVVPPVVVGYLLLIVLSPTSTIGGWLDSIGIRFAFHWTGAALASFLMALPLMIRAMRQAFEAADPMHRETATTLGAGPWRLFIKITLPLALPGVLSGLVLGFARAIGEFGATITFAANIPGLTQTLPLALYSAAQSPTGEIIAARLAIISLIPAVLSLIASEWLSRRALIRRGLKTGNNRR